MFASLLRHTRGQVALRAAETISIRSEHIVSGSYVGEFWHNAKAIARLLSANMGRTVLIRGERDGTTKQITFFIPWDRTVAVLWMTGECCMVCSAYVASALALGDDVRELFVQNLKVPQIPPGYGRHHAPVPPRVEFVSVL